MSRHRTIPIEDLALAYELREEYGMRWKSIARHLCHDPHTLNCAVRRAVRLGLHTS